MTSKEFQGLLRPALECYGIIAHGKVLCVDDVARVLAERLQLLLRCSCIRSQHDWGI